MKKKALIIFLLVVTMLTGCKNIRTITNINTLAKVAQNMSKQTNYQIKTTINLEVEEEEITLEMTNNINLTNEKEGQIEFQMDTGHNQSLSQVNGYTIINEDNITAYTYDVFNEKWIKTTLTQEEFEEEKLNLDFLDIPKIEYLRKEELDDKTKCSVYSIKLDDASFLTSIIGENQDIINLERITEEDLKSFLALVKFEMYIDTKEKLIRKMYIDLTDTYATYDRFDITIELNKFGEVEFDIPVNEIEAWLSKEGSTNTEGDTFNKYEVPTTYKLNTLYDLLKYEVNAVPLSFKVTDSIVHPTKPIIYFVATTDKAVYEVNYTDGSVRKVDFELPPESIAYHNEKLYITLLKGKHSSYWFTDDQEGAIAIVNASSMTIDKCFDINLDPFDIEVNKDGIICVSSGSGQYTNFAIYDENGLPGHSVNISERSYIKYNKILDRIYSINTNVVPRDMEAFQIQNAMFYDFNDSPYHGDYNLNMRFQLSPDGKYIFNGSGVIFSCNNNIRNDMTYKATLKHAFDDIAFDLDNNFYTSHGYQILKYDYKDNKVLGYYQTNNKIKFLHFNNGNVLAIGVDRFNNYFIEVIKE